LIAVITVDTTLSERYHLESLLGRGGMADVYRGRDLVLERPVAVKVVRGASEEDARRFAREIRTMAALSHPGIVQLFDAGTHDGAPYLVMELVEGSALPAELDDGPLDPERVARIGRELAHALARAHDLGIVHRDVKPANVLVDADGRARLSDFGIARVADATRVTTPGMTSGTAAYLAPEQLEGVDVGPAADVYALGLVLLEALTGRREFTGTPVEAAMARLHRDPEIGDDLPEPWPPLLRAMTARNPEQRPSAHQVAARLAGEPQAPPGASAATTTVLPAGQERPAPDDPAPEALAQLAPREAPRRRGTVAVAAVLMVAAALALIMASRGADSPAEETPPPARETTLPPEVDDALERLEAVVRP